MGKTPTRPQQHKKPVKTPPAKVTKKPKQKHIGAHQVRVKNEKIMTSLSAGVDVQHMLVPTPKKDNSELIAAKKKERQEKLIAQAQQQEADYSEALAFLSAL